MFIRSTYFVLILALTQSGESIAEAGQKMKQKIRQPAVAGQFYPADPTTLTNAVASFFDDAKPPIGEKPIALVSPHAGYIYSGQIAADAFNQATQGEYDVVVILGTNHTSPGFQGVSIYDGTGYRTPLGVVPIEGNIVRELIGADKDFTSTESVHAREHSVEVQLPFIQHILPGTAIVPAVIGQPDLDLCTRFGKALAKTLKNRSALIVASSDLSHYPGYDDAVKVDRATLEAIGSLDPAKFQGVAGSQLKKGIRNLSTAACGSAPIMTAMIAAKELGATRGELIGYANSGDVLIGDHSRVVGYGAVAFFAGENGRKGKKPEEKKADVTKAGDLDRDDKRALFAFARKTIAQYLRCETVPLARDYEAPLGQKRGAFVTLTKSGKLRGCIGHMEEDLPLYQVIGSMAWQAAFYDRRFPPLTLEELPETEIEISLLTPFRPIDNIEDFVIGRDGIILRKGGHSGVFLPKVATDQGWDRDQTLDHLCRKAGLSEGCWKEGAEFYTFQAEVFSESDLE